MHKRQDSKYRSRRHIYEEMRSAKVVREYKAKAEKPSPERDAMNALWKRIMRYRCDMQPVPAELYTRYQEAEAAYKASVNW